MPRSTEAGTAGQRLTRCPWAGDDPLMIRYHDTEWGVPARDDRMLFEFLVLEGAQAGLSWQTVLRKREAYRAAFAGFDPALVARFDSRRVKRLLADPGIVRNRLKVEGAVRNARAFLAVVSEFGSFHAWCWSFVGGRPLLPRRRHPRDVPATTPDSDALSAALRRRGFTFVGSTIVYAFMQAVGMVNDHLDVCFRRREIGQAEVRRAETSPATPSPRVRSRPAPLRGNGRSSPRAAAPRGGGRRG